MRSHTKGRNSHAHCIILCDDSSQGFLSEWHSLSSTHLFIRCPNRDVCLTLLPDHLATLESFSLHLLCRQSRDLLFNDMFAWLCVSLRKLHLPSRMRHFELSRNTITMSAICHYSDNQLTAVTMYCPAPQLAGMNGPQRPRHFTHSCCPPHQRQPLPASAIEK